jgi:hypothetical protein
VKARRTVIRSLLVPSLVLASSLAAASASAQAGATCVKASESGLDARDRGALRTARAHFVKCAAETCPKAMRVDCARWLDEVEASLPSIVVGAKDARGADLFDVRVKVDGEAVEDVQAGRPFVLDPGPHVVRFERGAPPDVETQDVKVLLRTGERNRAVTATMGAPHRPPIDAGPPVATSGGSIPIATWILGGAGVLALGSFTTFAILGSQEKSRLRGTCSPACTDADVSTLRTDYVVADISLGVGIVALGLATYFLLTNQSGASPRPAAALFEPQRFARTIWK